jgi:hypothetical protein
MTTTSKRRSVSFKITKADAALARVIARRARELYLAHKVDRDLTDIIMDLTATSANGCPMDFERLAVADNFNLMHDVGGIARHLDRETGKLGNHFSPRFRQRKPKKGVTP